MEHGYSIHIKPQPLVCLPGRGIEMPLSLKLGSSQMPFPKRLFLQQGPGFPGLFRVSLGLDPQIRLLDVLLGQ